MTEQVQAEDVVVDRHVTIRRHAFIAHDTDINQLSRNTVRAVQDATSRAYVEADRLNRRPVMVEIVIYVAPEKE
ncbi:hypothetical protein [Caballeronia sp. LZ032]|uniref:hypothetical protein n=1 Tax=Caballeronia sp. LZ032 TaxID=3038565 RepID=UPI002861C12E|nr:hypothetical protein [Caballeronia sp. LZ032]MDR5879034.1 hypothetical protein [Caballeronia sp. LZ032]